MKKIILSALIIISASLLECSLVESILVKYRVTGTAIDVNISYNKYITGQDIPEDVEYSNVTLPWESEFTINLLSDAKIEYNLSLCAVNNYSDSESVTAEIYIDNEIEGTDTNSGPNAEACVFKKLYPFGIIIQ